MFYKSSINFFWFFFHGLTKRCSFFNFNFYIYDHLLFFPYAISKWIKRGQPARSLSKDLSQSWKTVINFAMFFFLDEYVTLTNILLLSIQALDINFHESIFKTIMNTFSCDTSCSPVAAHFFFQRKKCNYHHAKVVTVHLTKMLFYLKKLYKSNNI